MIYTFYSYKGGVGRSMALANVAKWYYLRGLRVVMIDWDLEAPGLESFLYESQDQLEQVRSELGLIDMLLAYKRQFPLLPKPAEIRLPPSEEEGEQAKVAHPEQIIKQILHEYLPPLSRMLYRVEPSTPSDETDGRALWLLPAGWRSGDRFAAYAQAVQGFDWSEFYANFEGQAYFEWLRDQLETCADVVLIDSRTGVTEMSGVCTQQMADVVVSLCVPNVQNLDGIFTMLQSFKRPEVLQARGRTLEVVVVPARIDSSEIDYRNSFEARFKDLFNNDKFTPAVFRRFHHTFWDLSIPYVPKYAYSEKLAVGDPKSAAELVKAYNDLAVHLVMLAPEDHILRKHSESDLQVVFGKLSPELQKLLERPPELFISYALNDAEAFVRELQERLEWEFPEIIIRNDFQLEAGADWQKEITDTLDSVQAMVVVITPAALQSQFLSKQWRYARQRGVCIYPVIAPGQEIDFSSLPNWMRKIQRYDYRHSRDWLAFIAQLKSPCQAIPVPFMAPDLPPGFVRWPAELEQVLDSMLDTRRTSSITVALCGPAGSGKTVLATALCHDERIQETFDDGILWVTLGERSGNLIGKVEDLIYTLNRERPGFTTLDAAATRLAELLADRNVLLVIDDVWNKANLKPFLQGGKQSARLITTRDAEIASTFRTRRVNVEEMQPSEAVQMLATQLDVPPDDQRLLELAQRLYLWPLALELAGTALQQRLEKGDTIEGALRYLNRALDRRGIVAFDQRDATERNQAIAIAIETTLEQLTPTERERCIQLVTLHEGIDIPFPEICELWAMTDFETEELVEHLNNLSLLKFDHKTGNVSLYDVIRDYFAVRTWGDLYNLPHEYAWRRVGYQLVETGRKDELHRLLFDFNWLQAKLSATDVNALIADYALLPSDQKLQWVQGALRLSAHILYQDKSQLAGQLLGRLQTYKAPEIQKLLEGASRWDGAPWLRPLNSSLTPPGGLLLRTFVGHTSGVIAVAMTPDGQRAFSASADTVLKVWDLTNGVEVHTLSGHSGMITAVAITSDGQRALSASADGTLRVWELVKGMELFTLYDYLGGVSTAAMTLDGKYALSVSGDEWLKKWDLTNREELLTLPGHSSVTAVALDSDGKRGLSVSTHGILKVEDLTNGSILQSLSVLTRAGYTPGITAVAMTPDGQRALSASADGILKLWDLTNGVELQTLSDDSGTITAVAITADGWRALSASIYGTIRQWDLASGRELPALQGHTGPVKVVLTPDGRRALSGSEDTTLKLWDLTSGEESRTSQDHSGPVYTVLVTPDGQRALSVSEDRTLKVWELTGGTLLLTLFGHTDYITAVAMTPDGRRALSASWDHTLRIWDLIGGEELTLFGHTGPITAVLVTPDGQLAVSSAEDGTLRVWELTSGAQMFVLSGHIKQITAIALTPDGQRALSSTEDGTLYVWELTNGVLLHTLAAYPGRITTITVSPDGQRALSSMENGTLQVWDLNSGMLLHTLTGHTGPITALLITPDGRRALSASEDHTLRVWDLASGAQLFVLQGHTGQITAITLTPDGQRALSTSLDCSLKVWDLKNGNAIASFNSDGALLTCAVAPDGLTIVAGTALGRVHLLRLKD